MQLNKVEIADEMDHQRLYQYNFVKLFLSFCSLIYNPSFVSLKTFAVFIHHEKAPEML